MNLLPFIAMTEAEVRKEFAEDDEARLSTGEESLHDISLSAFIFLGLELEDLQCVFSFLLGAMIFILYNTHRRRIQREAKNTTADATAQQSGHLTEQWNILRGRIRT